MKKRGWILVLMLVAGAVVGLLLGELTHDISFLSWLSFGGKFGISPNAPMTLELAAFRLTFGVELNLTVAVVLCMGIAALLYRRFVK